LAADWLNEVGTTINLHLSEVPYLQAGDVIDDKYPVPAVYQKIKNI